MEEKVRTTKTRFYNQQGHLKLQRQKDEIIDG
jgi:hypothetical protein